MVTSIEKNNQQNNKCRVGRAEQMWMENFSKNSLINRGEIR